MPRLVDYVQCLHAIGQTTFQSLASASMKTIEKLRQNPDTTWSIDFSFENPTNIGEMVWECEWGKFISDLAWTCGAGRTRADLVNSSSVWSAGSSDGPVQAAGSGSAPPGCGYWRSSALYSAACPASVTATAQSHKPYFNDLFNYSAMQSKIIHTAHAQWNKGKKLYHLKVPKIIL